MEQIAVVKITKESGREVRRNMTLPKNIWEQILSINPEGNTTYELRKVEPVTLKETHLIEKEIKEVNLSASSFGEQRRKKAHDKSLPNKL